MGIPDTFLHSRSFRALPDEYDYAKATLQAMKNRDRAEIISMVGTRYSFLAFPRGRSGRPGRPSKHSSRAKVAAGVVRDEVVAAVAGAQGRGHGGRSSKGGGSSSRGGSTSTSSASGSSHGGGSRSPGRYWRCNRRGHIREERTTEESDFIAEYARCSRFNHEEST